MFRTGSPARFVVVFSVLVWLTGSSVNTAPMLPLDNDANGVVCDSSTGHCYEYVAGPLTWDAAKVAAEAMTHDGVSGHLATMTSQAETDFIVANLPAAVYFHGPFGGGAYIGAYQLPGSNEPHGGWQWVTGEPWSYTKWAGGEPNNSGGEDVLNFWSTAGAWNDVNRSLAKGYLVEYPAKSLGSDLVIGKAGEHGHRGNMAMLFGDGTGGFTMDKIEFSAFRGHEVAAGDLNKDGNDDVVVVASGGQVYVALGGFSDGLQNTDVTPVGAFTEGSNNCCDRTRVLQLGDLNNDGNLDIAVTMWSKLGVMLGNGDGTFGAEIQSNATGLDTRGMALGDLDGDGKIDLVANLASGTWRLAFHKGNGDGSFQTGVGIPNSEFAIPNLFISDADGDGDLDIYSGALGARLKVFKNNGLANFTKTDIDSGSGMQGALLVVDDLNGDGTPDMVAGTEANNHTNARVWLSNGSGGFAAADYAPVGSQPRHGVVADVNEDGIKDIAMVTVNIYGSNPGSLWILRGTGNGAFAAPYSVATYRNNYTIAAGNFDSSAAPTDTTPPVVTPTVLGTSVNGWYTSDVTVSWSVADAESTPTSACATQTVTSDTAGTTITCSATSLGGTTTQSVTIKRDTTGPAIASVTASPGTLWSPNHKMHAVTVSVNATDAGAGMGVCRIDSVGSNEGGNQHEPDVELTGDLTLNLRAERDGNAAGRIYTIHVSCRDAVGNTSTSTATVNVAHDQGKKK